MRRTINTLTLIGIALAICAVVYLLFGQMTGDFAEASTRETTLQIFALIGALLALVCGYMGRFMDRKALTPVSRVSNFGIFLGFISGLFVLAMPFL